MNNILINYEKVVESNLELAIKVQRLIFPKESGALNIKASVDKKFIEEVYGSNFRKSVDFWLCRDEKNDVVGITGIYTYFEYPDDAWCAWYGVLPESQGRGYGKKILLWTMEKAKEMGYKNFRLYTDLIDNHIAVGLYRKVGMIEEDYVAEDMGDEEIVIFSKNLFSEKTEKLGNKILFLKKQEEIQEKAKTIK